MCFGLMVISASFVARLLHLVGVRLFMVQYWTNVDDSAPVSIDTSSCIVSFLILFYIYIYDPVIFL